MNGDVDRDDIKNATMPAIEEFLKSQPGDFGPPIRQSAICPTAKQTPLKSTFSSDRSPIVAALFLSRGLIWKIHT